MIYFPIYCLLTVELTVLLSEVCCTHIIRRRRRKKKNLTLYSGTLENVQSRHDASASSPTNVAEDESNFSVGVTHLSLPVGKICSM